MTGKLIVGLIAILLVANCAFAKYPEGYGNVDIWMTNSPASVVPVKKFGWNETPYLYMHVPNASTGAGVNGTWWHSSNPGHETEYNFITALDSEKKLWFTFSDWHTAKKETGPWHVHINDISGLKGNYQTNFTVAPEPISSTLFLIGGAVLATRRYSKIRRRQKS